MLNIGRVLVKIGGVAELDKAGPECTTSKTFLFRNEWK